MNTIATTTPQEHTRCDEIIAMQERMKIMEEWKASTQADLKEIRDVVSQVKLLMSLSIGGGTLSILTLLVLIVELVTRSRQ